MCQAGRRRLPNEVTHKYLEQHHSSSVTPQNCERPPLNRTSAARVQLCPDSRCKRKIILRTKMRRRSGESNSFDKRRLNIGKKETLSPLPLVITVSMKSFPIIPLKTTPCSNMNGSAPMVQLYNLQIHKTIGRYRKTHARTNPSILPGQTCQDNQTGTLSLGLKK